MLRIKLVPRTRAKAFGLAQSSGKSSRKHDNSQPGSRGGFHCYHAHMTNPARLQRRPFLTPLWLFALTAMAAAAVLMFAAWLLVTA